MESCTLSVAKAGIICRLNARTSVLAAANPVESAWNSNKTIVENIQLPHTLMSRFDLIFLVLDPKVYSFSTVIFVNFTLSLGWSFWSKTCATFGVTVPYRVWWWVAEIAANWKRSTPWLCWLRPRFSQDQLDRRSSTSTNSILLGHEKSWRRKGLSLRLSPSAGVTHSTLRSPC